MLIGARAISIVVATSLFCGSLYAAYLHGRSTATSEIESEQAKQHNKQWTDLFALQGQLATRDIQLAEEQQKKAQIRTVKLIEKEVIYRDRIKKPDTAKCVADSGLLDLIDAANGIDSAKLRPAGAARRAAASMLRPRDVSGRNSPQRGSPSG